MKPSFEILVLFLMIVSSHGFSLNQLNRDKRESPISVMSTSNETVPSANRLVVPSTHANSAIATGVAHAHSQRAIPDIVPVATATNAPVTTNQAAVAAVVALPVKVSVTVTATPPIVTLANATGTVLQGQVNTTQGLPAANSSLNAGTNLIAPSELATIAHKNAVINSIPIFNLLPILHLAGV